MRSRLQGPAVALVAASVLALLVWANLHLALAHQWVNYHWPDGNIDVTIYSCGTEAGAARTDWNDNTDLVLNNTFVHSDISAYCDNFGLTGWVGLATVWTLGDGTITHGHARYNTIYNLFYSAGSGSGSGRRGVFCQELGHTFGLDHAAQGDCMAKGYFSPSSNITGTHSRNDINALY